MSCRVTLVTLVLAAACGPRQHTPRSRIDVQTDERGLSGLTVDDEGFLWSIAEDAPVVVRIDPQTGATTPFSIVGMPPGIEAESIAWLPGGRFAVGTEGTSSARRPGDEILYLSAANGEYLVEHRIECPYSQWGLQAEHNRGIEGLCAVGETIVVASEVVGESEGRRFAPFARLDPSGEWTAFRVWLTTEGGKISGLHCEAHGEEIRVLAIERHFGVTHLLEFDVPLEAELTPRIVAQFDEWMETQELSPNFEGIARMPDGRVALVIDNFYHRTMTGTSALWWVTTD